MNKAHLLIIEDEENLRKVVQRYFHADGQQVTLAADGCEGLAKFHASADIDLVLTDIRLPGMDGLAVLEEIKRHDPSVQVVLMTGYSDKEIAIQALRLGADDYVEKPFQLEDLSRIIQRALGRRRVQAFSERWLGFLEKLPLGFVWCDDEGFVQGVTRDAEELLETTEAEIIGKPVFEVTGCQSLKSWFSQDATSLFHPAQRTELEIGQRWLSVYRTQLVTPKGPPQLLLCFSNVTERKMIEQDLNHIKSEIENRVEQRTQSLKTALEFSDRLLNTTGVLIVFLASDDKPSRWNKFGQKLCGYSERELQKSDPCNLLAVKGDTSLDRLFHFSKNSGVSDYIAEIRTKQGDVRTLSWQVSPIRQHKKVIGHIVLGIDITSQKQLEAQLQRYTTHLEEVVEQRTEELQKKDVQLIHSARLASLGEMVAGIVHEMKQPLNGIAITADLLKLLQKRGELTEETLFSHLETVKSMIDRMSKIIDHLRGFSHIDSSSFTPIKLETVIDGAFAILGEQLRIHEIEVVRELADELPVVMGEPNQIEQVLVNLIQNARDAMDELDERCKSQAKKPTRRKKVLTIRTAATPDGKSVYIEVKDTGVGLSPEAQERLFEPFFTTKEAGQGTGLGLSISASIMQTHHGEIQAETKENLGATFRIVLPVASKEYQDSEVQ